MNVSFQRQHLAMLFKYAGISFISGAVNHGFFSGERSLWTAACGVVLFVAGAWMEHRLAADARSTGLARTLLWGTLLSIGLGFFTGGLQHFPDSPARSAWVVPLGFALSTIALAAAGPFAWKRGVVAYAVAGAALVTASSASAWQWLEANQSAAAPHHAHDDHAATSAPPALQAQVVTRTVEVVMDDTMRFTPSAIAAQPGETLRIVARNAGQVDHELVIGDEATIREHAEAMKHGGNHAHGTGAAVRVKPGQSGELVVTLSQPVVLQIACLVPGHYEAGMRGTLAVSAHEHQHGGKN
jgi:uncharacterized cupredoxin-like copper-binding protein